MTILKKLLFREHAGAATKDDGIETLLATINREMRGPVSRRWYDLKPSNSAAYKKLKKEPAERQADVARYLFHHRLRLMKKKDRTPYSYEPAGKRDNFPIFNALLRGALALRAEEVLGWAHQLHSDYLAAGKNRPLDIGFNEWPFAGMVQQVERAAKSAPLSEKAVAQLRGLLDWPELNESKSYYGTDFAKLRNRVENLLGGHAGLDATTVPYKKLGGDSFGDPLNDELRAQRGDDANRWNQVLNHAAGASGARPGKAFKEASRALTEAHGKEALRKLIQDWLGRALTAKPVITEQNQTWSGHTHTWTEERVFTDSNIVLLKGLVWMCDGFQDAKTVHLVADLCEKSMRKIPGRGPVAQATANACLWYLETTPGAEATARLSRLGTAIKQKSIQKKVKEIVAKKAEKAGITTVQLEERVVPDYGLEDGCKSVAFDDYTLQIRVDGPGRLTQTWLKPDGTPQKSKPKFIADKAALKARFDKAKAEIAVLKKVLSAQRDRVDRLFAEDLEWPLAEVEEFYVRHGLVGTIAAKLIWTLATGKKVTAALFRDGAWQDIAGKPVPTGEATKVRLWHPVDCPVDQVMAWRERLGALGIVQPTKQAHREIYLLTDAERRTDVYSNRMAAHMLKQHQMATLMAARGWRYQLMGAFDDGLDDQFASKTFVTSPLRAEYLIHSSWDDENWNDAGIYLYVGTDQLRFVESDDTPVRLETVPARLLSETMREADLFVGVASVGNDPAWFDQGPTPEARAYWQSYSFGNLDGFAETRKQVLEALLPRLKIRDLARIDGKFLVVKGKINTYKIHLGSSNILMVPGDRYLCIVPKQVPGGDIALPFEGDNRLSVILSKALMLAEDDKIEASDITRQLR